MNSVSASLISPGRWVALMPPVFVLIWSTGFVVARYGLPYAEPLTFLLLRFIGVLAVLLPLVLIARAPWPRGKMFHVAVAGVLLQAGYLGGVWCAIKIGMPAGLSALIVGLQPILTAFAAPLVGESVRPRQWVGLLFGLAGVGLVVADKISLAGLSWQSIALCVFALISITSGTLYQKRFCPSFDLRTGTVIQFAASIVAVLPFALLLEDFRLPPASVQWTPQFMAALLWSVLALSIGAIFLLFALIRKSAATQVTSLLYLTPPTTAVMAWLMFREAFSITGMLGMAVAVAGVALVVRK
ncbi:DMT family transporter [Noviherbaspirillum aridicola]|uniref:Peptide ABC transporter ATP-binding protein n=1 Tax=Noviherbaspirillum aridicola TaxID=2849687 RepID=A0ABQ4Q0D6_9BURK|nr:DMT family transporter [Noviherbaspirillum aridicola]GIZ50618.1 peptide ABC transporter ATP-binding protein [Noviherbaspirillum aridicola]